MNAVTQLPTETLEATLASYDIGLLQRFWPAANGIENSNYFVQTQRDGQCREYVLTIMEQPANAGDSYVPMMQALAAGGLPVPEPLPNIRGETITHIDGKPAMLQRRFPGRHIFNPTIKQISALGRFIARMHRTLQDGNISLPEYPRGIRWLAERRDMVRGYIPYTDQRLIETSVTKLESLLQRRDVAQLPRGMIHGDLFRDNLLFNELGLAGVLDFHHAATGYYIYDLAVAANDWCNDSGGGLDIERTTQLLKAYHQIRPLTQEEIWFFPSFALYGALAFWLSRLAVALRRHEAELIRFKNPDEFRNIVQQHLRHPFYLQPEQIAI